MKQIILAIMLFFISNINATKYIVKIGNEKQQLNIIVQDLINYKSALLSCSQGLLNEENKNCVLIEDQYRVNECPSDYLDQGNDVCQKIEQVNANSSCPSGYSNYSSNSCYKLSTRTPTSRCPGGSYSYGGNCVDIQGSADNCPSGYTVDAELSSCWKDGSYISATCDSGLVQVSYNDFCLNTSITVNEVFSCSSGYTLNGSVCEKESYTSRTYTCNSGYILSGTKCNKTLTDSTSPSACLPDYVEISDELCQKTTITSVIINCEEGYVYDIELDKCKK